MTTPTIHLQTGSSTVKCGAPMRHWRDQPDGWDLGTVTVSPGQATCVECVPALAEDWRDAYHDDASDSVDVDEFRDHAEEAYNRGLMNGDDL